MHPSRLAWILVFTACNGAAPPADEPVPSASAPVREGSKSAEPQPAKPEPTAPAEDWLVWFMRDGVPTTQWLGIAGDSAEVLAERRALIVGADARLWRLERNDVEVDVLACDCILKDDPADCKTRSRLRTLGLNAVALDDGTVTVVAAPGEGEAYGELFAEQGLSIVGGVGSTLLVRQLDESYACGAHPNYEHGVHVFDLVAGRTVEDGFGDWVRQLPEALRKPAGEELRKQIVECEEAEDAEAPGLDVVMAEHMFLNELAVALKAGVPELRWTFGADVVYSCSSYYYVEASATSGLLAEAAAVGLTPLPKGVSQALMAIGSAASVGWGRLELEGAARDAALTRFGASPEPPWPPETSSLVLDRSVVLDKVEAGRKHTREKDYGSAIHEFDAAIKSDPKLAVAYSGRGYAHLLAGHLGEARADFQAALEHDERPHFQAAVHFNLGQLAERSGDREAARAAYARSLELRSTKAAQAALDELDRAAP